MKVLQCFLCVLLLCFGVCATAEWELPNEFACVLELQVGDITIVSQFYANYTANEQAFYTLFYSDPTSQPSHKILRKSVSSQCKANCTSWDNTAAGYAWDREFCSSSYTCEDHVYLWFPQYPVGPSPIYAGKTLIKGVRCNAYQSTTDPIVLYTDVISGIPIALYVAEGTNDETLYYFQHAGSGFSGQDLSPRCSVDHLVLASAGYLSMRSTFEQLISY